MLASLSDDQIAQLGCVGALTIAIGITSLSYWLGSARKQATRPLSSSLPAMTPASRVAREALASAPRRKAA
jgi:hypothetical protein